MLPIPATNSDINCLTVGTSRQMLLTLLEQARQRGRQRLVTLHETITAHGPALLDDLRDAGPYATARAMDAALAALGGWLPANLPEYSQLSETQARYALVAARWRARGLLVPVTLPIHIEQVLDCARGGTLDALLAYVWEIDRRVGQALRPWFDGQSPTDKKATEWLLRAILGDPFTHPEHTHPETLCDVDAFIATRIALQVTGYTTEVSHD